MLGKDLLDITHPIVENEIKSGNGTLHYNNQVVFSRSVSKTVRQKVVEDCIKLFYDPIPIQTVNQNGLDIIPDPTSLDELTKYYKMILHGVLINYLKYGRLMWEGFDHFFEHLQYYTNAVVFGKEFNKALYELRDILTDVQEYDGGGW